MVRAADSLKAPEPLPPATTLGTVALTVRDLERSLRFYTESLGFAVRAREAEAARLGAGSRDILALVEHREARRARRTTGLYHFAVLLPSRRDLARSLARLVELRHPLQGAADHLVSEALYLADPDGNGIELYRDRARREWVEEDGALVMSTLPLDLDALLEEGRSPESAWGGLPDGTLLGHVHLHVDRIDAGERFYRDLLGLDLRTRYGDMASFFAAGGYHHHVAINTWQGVGAPRPPDGAIGLREFEIVLPDEQDVGAVLARMRSAGVEATTDGEGAFVRDPAGNGIRIVARRA